MYIYKVKLEVAGCDVTFYYNKQPLRLNLLQSLYKSELRSVDYTELAKMVYETPLPKCPDYPPVGKPGMSRSSESLWQHHCEDPVLQNTPYGIYLSIVEIEELHETDIEEAEQPAQAAL